MTNNSLIQKIAIDPFLPGQTHAVFTVCMKAGVVPLDDAIQSFGVAKIRGVFSSYEQAKEHSEKMLNFDRGTFTNFIMPVGRFFALAAKQVEEGDEGVDSIDLRKMRVEEGINEEIAKFADRKTEEEKAIIAEIQERAEKIRCDPMAVMPEVEAKDELESLLNDFFAIHASQGYANQAIHSAFGAASNYNEKMRRTMLAIQKDPSLMERAREQYLESVKATGGTEPPDFRAIMDMKNTLLTEASVKQLKNILDLGSLSPLELLGSRAIKRKLSPVTSCDKKSKRSERRASKR